LHVHPIFLSFSSIFHHFSSKTDKTRMMRNCMNHRFSTILSLISQKESSEPNPTKLLPDVIYALVQKAGVFDADKHLHPSLILAIKVGSYPTGAPRELHSDIHHSFPTRKDKTRVEMYGGVKHSHLLCRCVNYGRKSF
jgi:hypothetical protein